MLTALATASAGYAQTGYSPPAWYTAETGFIEQNNPAADCAPRDNPNPG